MKPLASYTLEELQAELQARATPAVPKEEYSTVEGILFVLPYSGWAEVLSSSGLSILWFAPGLAVSLVAHVGHWVTATCDSSLSAVRRLPAFANRDQVIDVPRLTAVSSKQPAKPVSREVRSFLAIAPEQPDCWVDGCRYRAEPGKGLCELHIGPFVAGK